MSNIAKCISKYKSASPSDAVVFETAFKQFKESMSEMEAANSAMFAVHKLLHGELNDVLSQAKLPVKDYVAPEVKAEKSAPKEVEKAVEPAEKVEQAEGKDADSEVTAPIEDVGEKIGGARKDLWKERGIRESDLDAMMAGEQAKYVTKANVWKPDYAALIDNGVEIQAAALLKVLYDGIASKPKTDTDLGRRQYVKMLNIVRNAAEKIRTVADVNAIESEVMSALEWANKAMDEETRQTLFSIYRRRSSPLRINYSERRKASKLVEAGFPNIEPWQRRFDIRNTYGGGFAVVAKGTGRVVARDFTTQDEAIEAAKTAYADLKTDKGEGQTPERPHLDKLQRVGKDIRGDKDVTPDDFMSAFGFRGVEFGNWAANDERQTLVNLGFEALHDLADVLGIPPKAVSLNGTLGLAFGARGSRFAAHYEPGKLVINLAKKTGAGAVAHEWAHALDHYFGEQNQDNSYGGTARGVSGWHSIPGTNPSATNPQLRPTLKAAFDGVITALFRRNKTKAEAVRDAELQLEKLKGNIVQQEAQFEKYKSNRSLVKSTKKWLDWARQRLPMYERQLAKARDEKSGFGKVESSYYAQSQKLSGKSGKKGYWSRPTEMFARAFESYVFDVVKAKEMRSDYLVQGVEADRYTAEKGYKGNPYPVGEEREAINAAFDKVFQIMESKETEQGVALFKVSDTPRQNLADTPVNELLTKAEGDEFYSRKLNNNVELSENAAELVKRAIKEAYQRNAHTFDGVFFDADVFSTVVPILRKIVKRMEVAGYTANGTKEVRALISQLNQVAKAKQGTAILYVFDEALPEETIHQQENLAGGLDGEARKIITSNPLWAESEKGRFKREYGHLKNQNNVMSEFVAKLATGQEVKYGWDTLDNFRRDRQTILEAFSDGLGRSLLAKNPDITTQELKKHFYEVLKYGATFKEKTDTATSDTAGTEDVRPDEPDTQQDSEKIGDSGREVGEAVQGGDTAAEKLKKRKTIASAEKAGVIEEGEISVEDSHYAVKSVDGNIREAQDRIDDIGLATSATEAVKPLIDANEQSLRQHGTFQMETAHALFEAAREAQAKGDKDLANVFLTQKKAVITAVAEQGTDAGQFIRQLGEWRVFDPDSIAEYVEKRRSQNGIGEPLSVEDSLRLSDLAKDYENKESKIKELEAKIKALESEPSARKPKITGVQKKMFEALLKRSKDAMRRLKQSGVPLMMVSSTHQPKNQPKVYDAEDAMWLYHETLSESYQSVWGDFLQAEKGGIQEWTTIKRNMLVRVWNDFITDGYVKEVESINYMQTRILKNVVQLDINTFLMGHKDSREGDPLNTLNDDYEIPATENDLNRFADYAVTAEGQWAISDYGLPKVQEILFDLLQAETSEAKLKLIDRLLNVIHQRSDLAEFFVEGGSSTLNELAGEDLPAPLYSVADIPPQSLQGQILEDLTDVGAAILFNGFEQEPMMSPEQFEKELIKKIGKQYAENWRQIHAESLKKLDVMHVEIARQNALARIQAEKGNENLTKSELEAKIAENIEVANEKTKIRREHRKLANEILKAPEKAQKAVERDIKKDEAKDKKQREQIARFLQTADEIFDKPPTDEEMAGALLLELGLANASNLGEELGKRFDSLNVNFSDDPQIRKEKRENRLKAEAKGAAIYTAVRKAHRVEDQARRGQSDEAYQELLGARRDRTKSMKNLLDTADNLERLPAGKLKTLAQLSRMSKVALMQTTATNLLSTGAERVMVSKPIDTLDIGLQKMFKGLANEGLTKDASLKYVWWTPKNKSTLDGVGDELTKGLSKHEMMLRMIDFHPEYFQKFYGEFSSDLDAGMIKVMDKFMFALRWQEFLMRDIEGINVMAQIAKQKGLDFATLFDRKGGLEQFTQEDVEFVLNRVLDLTYAQRPKYHKGAGATDYVFGEIVNKLRTSGVIDLIASETIPFTGFMYNTIQKYKTKIPVIAQIRLLTKTAQAAAIKKQLGEEHFWKQAVQENWTSKQLANQIWGLTALTLITAIVRSLGDADDWNLIRIPFTEGMGRRGGSLYFDVRTQPMLSPLFFIANKMNRLINGKPMFTYNGGEAESFVEAFGGLSYRQAVEGNNLLNTMWYGAKALFNKGFGDDTERDGEKFMNFAAKWLGNTAGTMTNFLQFKTMKDIFAQIDTEEQRRTDLEDSPFLQGIDVRLPESRKLFHDLIGWELETNAATGFSQSYNQYPALKVLGFNLRDEDTIRKEASAATMLAAKLRYGGEYLPAILPDEKKRDRIKRQFEQESDKLRGAGDTEGLLRLSERLKALDTEGLLRPGQTKYADKAIFTSDLQENFKSLSAQISRFEPISKAERIWRKANYSEKQELKQLYITKLDNLIKKGEGSSLSINEAIQRRAELGPPTEKEAKEKKEHAPRKPKAPR